MEPLRKVTTPSLAQVSPVKWEGWALITKVELPTLTASVSLNWGAEGRSWELRLGSAVKWVTLTILLPQDLWPFQS